MTGSTLIQVYSIDGQCGQGSGMVRFSPKSVIMFRGNKQNN